MWLPGIRFRKLEIGKGCRISPFGEIDKRRVREGKENWAIQQLLEAIWNNRAVLFSYLRLRLQMKVNKSPYRPHKIRFKLKQIEDLRILSETAINLQ